MSALSDQLRETNKLLSGLHISKQKRRKVAERTNQKFSRVENKKQKRSRLRTLPIVLTRTAVIAMVLLCFVVVFGTMQYLNDRSANAISNDAAKEMLHNQQIKGYDDSQLLDALSKR